MILNLTAVRQRYTEAVEVMERYNTKHDGWRMKEREKRAVLLASMDVPLLLEYAERWMEHVEHWEMCAMCPTYSDPSDTRTPVLQKGLYQRLKENTGATHVTVALKHAPPKKRGLTPPKRRSTMNK